MERSIGRDDEEFETSLVRGLKQWQAAEDESMQIAEEIQARTRNPLVRLVMEIIVQDSAMHRRVQQFIIDSVERKNVLLAPEDLRSIENLIEKHAAAEKDAIALAKEASERTELFVPHYLLRYLLEDERKHDSLLDRFVENRM